MIFGNLIDSSGVLEKVLATIIGDKFDTSISFCDFALLRSRTRDH